MRETQQRDRVEGEGRGGREEGSKGGREEGRMGGGGREDGNSGRFPLFTRVLSSSLFLSFS